MSQFAVDHLLQSQPFFSSPDTIGRFLERLAIRSPGSACLLYPGRDSLSYESLYSQLLRVERSLRQAGLGRSSRVAAALPDGAEASVAFFTVSACCTYAPANIAESLPFFEAAFRRLEPSAVIVSTEAPTHASVAARAIGIPLIEIEPLPSSAAGLFDLHFSARTAPSHSGQDHADDLALLLPTSGATGESKLVMHSHRTLLNAAQTLAHSFQLDASDRCINISPLFHSLGLTGGLMMAAVSGSSVVAAPRFHPDLFYEWMDKYQPTWFSAVPSALEALHGAAGKYEHVLRRSRLRFFRTAAAPMNPNLDAELESCFHAPLIHVYGMSEAPPITIQPLHCRKPGSVGVATGVDLLIRNDDGAATPQGEVGEVTLRGAHVATGYFRDPAATSRAFRNGWFHTGDRGYLDADGHLFLTGRIHDTINRGGEKIGPREIESVFETHPEVLEAVVFPIPHSTLGEDVAVAVRTKNSFVSPQQLQRFATSRLAFHKIPRQFLFVEQIPLLSTGKLDRRLLRRWFEQNPPAPLPHVHVEPRNPVEILLASAWAEVLGIQNPGIHDSFFESGGDSLAAVTLLTAVSRDFNRPALPIGFLFEAPTIAEMAVFLSKQAPFVEPEVFAMQPSGSRNPLFFIDAGLEYRHLTKLLSADQPLFSIRMPDFEAAAEIYTVEQIAARCLQALRRFQPKGPYQLAGWCFAGVVAFEMARQLSLQGEQVPMLGLFDARGILPIRGSKLRKAWISCHENWIKVRYHLRTLRKMRWPEAHERLRGLSKSVGRRLVRKLWKSSNSVCLALNSSPPFELSADHFAALALERYRPEPYAGSILHLWSTDRPPTRYRQFPGEWTPYVSGPMTLREIPGNHVTMFEPPHVEILAQQLQKYLP